MLYYYYLQFCDAKRIIPVQSHDDLLLHVVADEIGCIYMLIWHQAMLMLLMVNDVQMAFLLSFHRLTAVNKLCFIQSSIYFFYHQEYAKIFINRFYFLRSFCYAPFTVHIINYVEFIIMAVVPFDALVYEYPCYCTAVLMVFAGRWYQHFACSNVFHKLHTTCVRLNVLPIIRMRFQSNLTCHVNNDVSNFIQSLFCLCVWNAFVHWQWANTTFIYIRLIFMWRSRFCI